MEAFDEIDAVHDIDAAPQKLEQMWTRIEPYLREQGGASSNDIAENVDFADIDLSEKNIESHLLHQLRDALDGHYIRVETETVEPFGTKRKVWHLLNGDTQ